MCWQQLSAHDGYSASASLRAAPAVQLWWKIGENVGGLMHGGLTDDALYAPANDDRWWSRIAVYVGPPIIVAVGEIKVGAMMGACKLDESELPPVSPLYGSPSPATDHSFSVVFATRGRNRLA
uniref:Uncharacterized protein n=1 Tax=Plectus sambesii TaxID=2011161 RepID=A0A914VZH1_9BILA